MIVAAAIMINNAVISMAAPARHHDILRQIAGLYDPEERPHWTYENETQGFITDKGEFLDRKEAWEHVSNCGQGAALRYARLRNEPNTYNGMNLYSEDLW